MPTELQKCMNKKLREMKGEMNKSTIIVGQLKTSSSEEQVDR